MLGQTAERWRLASMSAMVRATDDTRMNGATYKAATQLYLYDDRVAFMATYTAAAQDYRALKPILDYSFQSLRVGE